MSESASSVESNPTRTDTPMDHYFDGYDHGENRDGYPTYIWQCACGRRGTGSRNLKDAEASYIRHQRGRARKNAR